MQQNAAKSQRNKSAKRRNSPVLEFGERTVQWIFKRENNPKARTQHQNFIEESSGNR